MVVVGCGCAGHGCGCVVVVVVVVVGRGHSRSWSRLVVVSGHGHPWLVIVSQSSPSVAIVGHGCDHHAPLQFPRLPMFPKYLSRLDHWRPKS